MTKIAIINYQAGNLRSVQKALEKVGANVQVTSEPDEILSSDGVVFPGQGACDSSMKNLRKKQLDMIITDVIKQGKPFLGVCLGMQLLLENSEEGNENCLGILSGKVRELPNSMKIPHMGWNQVKILRDNLLFKNIPQHSFLSLPLLGIPIFKIFFVISNLNLKQHLLLEFVFLILSLKLDHHNDHH